MLLPGRTQILPSLTYVELSQHLIEYTGTQLAQITYAKEHIPDSLHSSFGEGRLSGGKGRLALFSL